MTDIEKTNMDKIANTGLQDSTQTEANHVSRFLREFIQSQAQSCFIEQSGAGKVAYLRRDSKTIPLQNFAEDKLTQIHSRIRILAGLEEERAGRIEDASINLREGGKAVHLRLNFLPGVYGENIIIHRTNNHLEHRTLDAFDLSDHQSKLLEEFVAKDSGVLLVAGPEPYSCMEFLRAITLKHDASRTKIAVIEGPHETGPFPESCYTFQSNTKLSTLEHIHQLQQMDFDLLCVTWLSNGADMDPLLEAPLNFGKKVLAYIPGCYGLQILTRMLHMGVTPWLLGNNDILIHSHKPLGRICPQCREPADVSTKVLLDAGMSLQDTQNFNLYHGAGCEACDQTGFAGSTFTSETMLVDDNIKHLLLTGATLSQLKKHAMKAGYLNSRSQALKLLTEGKISFEQVQLHTETED